MKVHGQPRKEGARPGRSTITLTTAARLFNSSATVASEIRAIYFTGARRPCLYLRGRLASAGQALGHSEGQEREFAEAPDDEPGRSSSPSRSSLAVCGDIALFWFCNLSLLSFLLLFGK